METNVNPAVEAEVKPAPSGQEEPALEQQLKILKKIHFWGIVRTAACLAVAVILLVAAMQVVPQLLALLAELGTVAENLAAVDFAGLTEQLNQLAVAGSDGIGVATEALTDTMAGLNKINFEALGSSVEGLAAVVDSLKAVTDGMSRIFGR